MLGVQVLLLCLVSFIVGAEASSPGVLKSTIVAAAEVRKATIDHTAPRLCAKIQAHGGVCATPASTSPAPTTPTP
jgi:hypothetical protein